MDGDAGKKLLGGRLYPKGPYCTHTSVKVLPDFYEKCWRTGNTYQKIVFGREDSKCNLLAKLPLKK